MSYQDETWPACKSIESHFDSFLSNRGSTEALGAQWTYPGFRKFVSENAAESIFSNNKVVLASGTCGRVCLRIALHASDW